VSFENVWELYQFDKNLRLLVSDAIESIEVALRTSLSNIISLRYGPLWYMEQEAFKKNGTQLIIIK